MNGYVKLTIFDCSGFLGQGYRLVTVRQPGLTPNIIVHPFTCDDTIEEDYAFREGLDNNQCGCYYFNFFGFYMLYI